MKSNIVWIQKEQLTCNLAAILAQYNYLGTSYVVKCIAPYNHQSAAFAMEQMMVPVSLTKKQHNYMGHYAERFVKRGKRGFSLMVCKGACVGNDTSYKSNIEVATSIASRRLCACPVCH